ncbi:MAG: hypothetical protein D6689_16075 [Deltaproteobacteria bacterium]|nr:MAG: hypothetical protein D6689_16075 [Deltaproteobacteria bacterium]
MPVYLRNPITTALVAAGLAVAGCADDIGPDPSAGADAGTGTDADVPGRIAHTDNGDGTTTTRVDASREGVWVYLDLETKAEVDPATPDDSDDWDLAFQRFKIKSNGGASGTGGVEVAVLPDADFDALSRAPEVGYIVDAPDSDDDDEDPDTAFLGGDGWYDYDPSSHTLSPRDIVYVVRTVEGGYFKLQMLDYYDDAGTSGFPTFRWGPVEPPAGSPPEPLVVDASDGSAWVYVSLRLGAIVAIDDPGASTDWDLGVSRTKLRTNSGTSGPGAGGAVDTGATAIEDVASAPTDGYEIDTMLPLPGPPGSGEFSGNPVLNGWYDYDPTTHTTTPKAAVYVVRTADGGFAKLQIADYADGVLTVRWAYAGAGSTEF